MKDLKGNKMLSMEAKHILSDLELDSDDESGRYFSLIVNCNFMYYIVNQYMCIYIFVIL